MSENVLDAASWKFEAEAVIQDVKAHVNSIKITENLGCNNRCVYLNLSTIENGQFCVELSALGFRVVGNAFDTKNLESGEYFETPYSLLGVISPRYNESFSEALLEKLKGLQQ